MHCGADVRHFGATEHFNNVNVNGTRYLLELAERKPGIHFHYVSTIGIPEELAAIQWGGQKRLMVISTTIRSFIMSIHKVSWKQKIS
ncbi:SDR family oxidoreductase [Lysinibacillus sp. MHQ-1]|nr:SDR family oxidoreductase [Lysinibacillus sp. MHQ-1]